MLKFLYQVGTGLHLDVARALVLPRELSHLFPNQGFSAYSSVLPLPCVLEPSSLLLLLV